MKKRRIIVDRKFQYNIAAAITGLSAIIMAIIIIILSSVLISNNARLGEISRNQQELSATQDEIFKSLVALSDLKNLGKMHISTEALGRDNNNTKKLLDQNNIRIGIITGRNEIIIALLIISAVIQSAILFYFMLRRSHRISGPLFLLNRYIDEMKKGGLPEIRPLRSNDDFQDVFENFRELVKIMKEQHPAKGKGKHE